MHVITGMLIAGLLRRKRTNSLASMFASGPVRVVHALAGRVRLRVETSRLDERQAELLREKLPTLDGVRSVEVDATTGSVLVRYRENLVEPELLYAAVVRLLGLDADLKKSPRPVVVKELRSIFDSLNRVVYDKTGGLLDFSSALLILLAGLGAKKMLTDGMRSVPQGFTLLWWGVHHLLGQPHEVAE